MQAEDSVQEDERRGKCGCVPSLRGEDHVADSIEETKRRGTAFVPSPRKKKKKRRRNIIIQERNRESKSLKLENAELKATLTRPNCRPDWQAGQNKGRREGKGNSASDAKSWNERNRGPAAHAGKKKKLELLGSLKDRQGEVS